MSDIPTKVRKLVLARDGGACVRCGGTGALELHHRRYKSRGGKHDASNLVSVCGWGNHTGCHGWAHTDTKAPGAGYSLPSGRIIPREIPVLMYAPGVQPFGSLAWALLDDDGGRNYVSDAFANEIMTVFGLRKDDG